MVMTPFATAIFTSSFLTSESPTLMRFSFSLSLMTLVANCQYGRCFSDSSWYRSPIAEAKDGVLRVHMPKAKT
jgi:hypothetical protein